MKKSLKFSLVVYMLTATSCSTLNKSLIYSSISGAVLGGFVGKELSPNKESNNLNGVIGAGVGALASAGIGYALYKDAHPELELKQSPLKEDVPLGPIEDQTFGMDKIKLTPKIRPVSKKEYLKFSKSTPKDIQDQAKRQYFKKYKTEVYTFEQDGKSYKVPSFEIIENGVE
jgi:hypothetical protein